MTLLELEPGVLVAPDLVTAVRGERRGDAGGYWVNLDMVGGSSVRVSGRSLRVSDAREAERLAADEARRIGAIIDQHRSPEGITIITL